jgi:hypothetical protein
VILCRPAADRPAYFPGEFAKIEIGVLKSRRLDRRIDNQAFLVSDIAAWEKRRNDSGERIAGCSPPKKPAKNSPRPIPQSKPKSHNR